MKKFLAILLAAMMLLAVTAAFADEAATTYTITINNATDGYVYQAYQIFKGDLSGQVLSNIEWGAGVQTPVTVSGTTYNTAKELSDALTATENPLSAADMADALVVTTAQGTSTFADGEYTISNLPAGYYLVKNTTIPEGGAYTKFIVKIVCNTEATPKTGTTEHYKKVNENVKAADSAMAGGFGLTNYNDVADYNIGDEVPFSIYSKVPDMTNYDAYKMVFEDDMSDGLTYVADSLVVYIGNDVLDASKYGLVMGSADTDDFTLTIENLKAVTTAVAGTPIRIDFKAKLNSNAVIGLDGNPNKSRLTYSNNPNTTDTATTPWDEVVVFTYELDVTKVDGADTTKKLADAEFQFYRGTASAPEYVIVDSASKVTGWTTDVTKASTFKTDSTGIFKVIGLDDGTYYLKETKAPATYNKLTQDITVVVKATTANNQTYAGTASNALTKIEITAGGKTTEGVTSTGIVSTEVLNNKGATLPETGGIGTTLFYLFGGLMAAGSALILVVRRRADADEE